MNAQERSKLIEENVVLAAKIIAELQPKCPPQYREATEQIGIIGLIKGVDAYQQKGGDLQTVIKENVTETIRAYVEAQLKHEAKRSTVR